MSKQKHQEVLKRLIKIGHLAGEFEPFVEVDKDVKQSKAVPGDHDGVLLHPINTVYDFKNQKKGSAHEKNS